MDGMYFDYLQWKFDCVQRPLRAHSSVDNVIYLPSGTGQADDRFTVTALAAGDVNHGQYIQQGREWRRVMSTTDNTYSRDGNGGG
jgi:hypothetical protein